MRTLAYTFLLASLLGTLTLPKLSMTQSAERAAWHAARAPVYALAGTDPDALAEETSNLADVVRQLAKTQPSTTEQAAVRTLYPLRFLAALSRAEERRQALTSSPSSFQREAYIAALYIVAIEKQYALDTFATTWNDMFGTSTARIVSFGGTIEMPAARMTLSKMRLGMENERARLASYVQCLRGSECRQATVPPDAPTAEIVEHKDDEPEALWREARGGSNLPSYVSFVYLSFAKSVCLGAQPAPYPVVLIQYEQNGKAIPFLSNLGDIFFVSTDGAGQVLTWERERLGMQYTPLNPFKYYTCPELGIDLSEALTAYASTTGSAAEEELRLMRIYKTAGLEFLVHEIVHVLGGDLRKAREGVPFDLSVRNLFLAHSAFPSFLRIGSDADALWGLRRSNQSDQAAFFSDILPYSAIRATVPREILLHDLRSFLKFENY